MHDAKIIALTKPHGALAESIDHEDLVAYVARVSNPANQMNTETAPRLLRYLIREKHWSPFEMVSITMEITTTRDIARQILRHRSFSFQEFSQRYANPTEALGFVYRDVRMQDPKNRQNSTPTDDAALTAWWTETQRITHDAITYAYATALRNGIAKEVARALLPEGLTASRLYMAGTLRSWIHYVQVRSGNGTQAEHAAVALSAWERIVEVYPVLAEVSLTDTQ